METATIERTSRGKRLAASQKPRKETIHGMLYVFQVFYRELEGDAAQLNGNGNGDVHLSGLKSMLVYAETANEARGILAEDESVHVVTVGPGRPDPDYLASAEIFDYRGAAAFLGYEQGTIQNWPHDKLPRDKSGICRFTRSRLLGLAKAKGEE
jgi:hypothetical protein